MVPDLTKWIIPALLALVMMFILRELRRGLRKGEIQQFTNWDSTNPKQMIRRDNEPITFWCLFIFYVVAVIALLAMMGVIILGIRLQ